MRFFQGLLVGLLALAAYVAFQHYGASRAPCEDRCGQGTRCSDGRCVAAATKRRRRRGRKRRKKRQHLPQRAGESLREPSATQLRRVVRGPKLNKAERLDMTRASSDAPELSQEAITARVRRIDDAVIACIANARRGYAFAGVRIELRFRVERAGNVSAVQLAAPALMHEQGLDRCVRPLVSALRFPRSAAAVVATYPYSVD